MVVGVKRRVCSSQNVQDDVGQSSFQNLDGFSYIARTLAVAAILITPYSPLKYCIAIYDELDCMGVGARPHLRLLDVH